MAYINNGNCVFTGLLTPLGDVPYTYLPKTMAGNTMDNISEHLPLTLIQDVKTIVVLVLFLLILIFTDVKIKLRDIFMLAGLIYLHLCLEDRYQCLY